MNKLLISALLVFLLFAFSSSSYAQTTARSTPTVNYENDYNVRGMFIFNFLRYIKWPEDGTSKDFVIGVYNDDQMYDVLYKSFGRGAKGARKYKVVNLTEVNSNTRIDLLFVPRQNSKMLPEILEAVASQSTLVVTDRNGLAEKGSSINFKVANSKLVFEMNMQAIEKANLKVAGQLAQVAIVI